MSSTPSSSTRPAVTGTSPLTARSSVDLPAPLAPRTATEAPSATCSDTSRRAGVAAYETDSPDTVSTGLTVTAGLANAARRAEVVPRAPRNG